MLSLSGFKQLHVENNFCSDLMRFAKNFILISIIWFCWQNILGNLKSYALNQEIARLNMLFETLCIKD